MLGSVTHVIENFVFFYGRLDWRFVYNILVSFNLTILRADVAQMLRYVKIRRPVSRWGSFRFND
jgi:hypothetical protein